VQAVKTIYFFD